MASNLHSEQPTPESILSAVTLHRDELHGNAEVSLHFSNMAQGGLFALEILVEITRKSSLCGWKS